MLTIHLGCGFYPRIPPHWKTKTHFDITNTGILQAVSEYIYETKNTSATSSSSALNAFFGTDYNGMARLFETVRQIKLQLLIHRNKKKFGYIHCNADQIKQGIKGKQLMEIANQEEDTCIDVQHINKDCKDNMLVEDKLTSGYHHGRGNMKPPRSRGSKTGKCSHGGPDDTSRRLPAKCGINKDTTIERLSPHYHLHNDAYLAAVAATKHFLINKATLNKAYSFTSGTDMIQAISEVKVNGGGDCPELAAAGILNAINLSLPDSTIIVFTDADAKDANRALEIEKEATFKKSRLLHLRTKETFSTPTASRILTDKKDLIMSIQKLSLGMHYLRRTEMLPYKVNMTVQSSIEVDGEIIEENQNGSSLSVEGSPIVGNNTGVLLLKSIYGSNKKEMSYEPTVTFSDIDLMCSADIVVPDITFQVKVNAIDEANAIIIRTVPFVVKPTGVELTITSYRDDIPLDKENKVSYSIVNTGSKEEMYNVRFDDEKSFALGPRTHYHNLNSGDQANGSFILFPQNDVGVLTYSVIAEMNSTLARQQTITKRVSVTKTERPICEVLSVFGKCEFPSLNTANCSKFNWSAESILHFRETQIESISSSGGSAVHLAYQDLTDITEGPVTVGISGVCCTPYVTIDVTDVDGFMSRCILDLSDGLQVESADPVEDVISIPSAPTNLSKSFAVIGAVSGCVIFLCVVIMAGVIANTYLKRKDKTKDDCIKSGKSTQNRPMKHVQNVPYSFQNRLVKFK
ncbi:unnamed protein product [Mytilus edulis]|uniref:Uncharacterized protein n=1 Tax=Mytilus edulis TaxID=6550 RepID=A0A8S3RBH4_MYTED|nr:unnamed protein product [Mytilus edulis]